MYNKSFPTQSSQNAGMTLIEVIMTITISTVILIAMSSMIVQYYQHNAHLIAQASAVENAQRGLGTLTRDIREITFSHDGTFPIASRSTTSIAIYVDTDADSLIEYIEYRLVGTNLERRIYKPSGSPLVYDFSNPDQVQIVSSHVQNATSGIPIFQYATESGEVATDSTPISQIRFVMINLQINQNPDRIEQNFELMGSVAPRNLRTNI